MIKNSEDNANILLFRINVNPTLQKRIKMKENKAYPSQIRSLPYFNSAGSSDDYRLAATLRREFVPKVKRLLPGHHLGAYRHDFIVNFIRRHKVKYPCFIRTDIKRFYPSVSHRDIIAGCQLAYRDLLNLRYVPHSFKEKYVGAIATWCRCLPLYKGISLGSPLSAILAPVMLISLWLQVKRRFGVPFIVYMDDVLICTADENQSMEIYAYIGNYLQINYELDLNTFNTSSGRFSRNSVEFCSWRFTGGYAVIAEEKLVAFRQRMHDFICGNKCADIATFIKMLNRKIDGFGHYYKFGHVAGQFRALDMFIRKTVRYRLSHLGGFKGYTVKHLSALGLHCLSTLFMQAREANRPTERSKNGGDRPVPVTTMK
jgi:hypothetical protein